MERSFPTALLVGVLLLFLTATLMYLEWWRSGELELLNHRVDELEVVPRRRAAARKKSEPEVKT